MRKKDLFPASFSEVKEFTNPTLRHRLYYDFLKISPSYFLVHQYKNKRVNLAKIKQIDQYEKVIELYKLFGDVFNVSFDNWWRKKGYTLFEPSQKFHVLVKIDLQKSLSVNQEILKAIYQTNKSKIRHYAPVLTFEKNKIQEHVLQSRLALILECINSHNWFVESKSNDAKKIPSWFFAYTNRHRLFGRMRGESFKKIKLAINFIESTIGCIPEKLKGDNIKYYPDRPYRVPVSVKYTSSKAANKAKRYLSMLVSKNKREALVIAENAARGFFPNKNLLLNNYSNFNFDELNDSSEFIRSIERTLDEFDMFPYVVGSNEKAKRRLDAERDLEMEIEHRLLESIDTDLKNMIDKKVREKYLKEYKNIDQVKSKSKSTQRRSVSVRR